MKTGIVCEGGAMRGVYTAGVLQAFMDEGFLANELVGVSAGASNGASYVSGQNGRGFRTNVDYCGDKRYLSKRNWLRTGSMFGMDFIFGEIPQTLDPFDFDAFQASPCDYYAGALDIETGKTHYFGKADIKPGLYALRASCSMPVLSTIVEIEGKKYLDGGVSAPIPIDKALDDGCEKIIVVLTQHRGYRKKPQSARPVYHALYKKYPNLVKAMDLRHMVYNHTLERLCRLEEEGRAIIVAPDAPLGVDRFGQNRDAMVAAYNTGGTDARKALEKL